MNLFGVGAVRNSKAVDMVVKLELWDKARRYDRLGTETGTKTIFNVDLPEIAIPVREGRNLSTIIEIAAMNQRAKEMGYDAAATFQKNLGELIKKNTNRSM